MKIYASHLVFPVPNLDATASFYEKQMGFRRVDYRESAQPHTCLYRDKIEIILVQTKDGHRVVPNCELYGGGEDAYIIADDLEELQYEFAAAGVTVVEPLHMTDYSNREFTVRDFDGRHLIFGMKQWQQAGDKIWEELYTRAQSLIHDRNLSKLMQAGAVAAAIITAKGNIYTGVCIDTASSLGMCAERNAMANMITNGEKCIRKVVAVMWDGSVGSPCGACREFMMQLDDKSKDIEILVDYAAKKTVTLGELMPDWWGYKI